jgi:glycosyltransferase involved in cell wall biosynthesis
MKEKILWICPSRKRPERLERLIKSWKNTTTNLSDLLVVIDSDDDSYQELIKKYPEVIWEITDPVFGSFLHLINSKAVKYSTEYQYIGFMEDDIVFETSGYESRFIKKLKELGKTGIVHAKDGIDKRKFVSIPVVDSYIIRTLGWFAPPCLKSLWADNFWREMATAVGTYYKFEDVVIKHYHYSRDENTSKDETSIIVDNNFYPDKEAFYNYLNNDFKTDMEKLLYA